MYALCKVPGSSAWVGEKLDEQSNVAEQKCKVGKEDYKEERATVEVKGEQWK